MRNFFVKELKTCRPFFNLILFRFRFLGAFKFCDFNGDGWISREDLVESIELIHQLMGNMFNLTIKNNVEPIEDINDENTIIIDTAVTTATADNLLPNLEETFTPQNRAKYLFNLMDEDNDGKADYTDFKRVVLADSEIIRGFLVYDGVI
jgi:Ca2+-binding EF-hand superfamily protein